jgi:hypothetical protein
MGFSKDVLVSRKLSRLVLFSSLLDLQHWNLSWNPEVCDVVDGTIIDFNCWLGITVDSHNYNVLGILMTRPISDAAVLVLKAVPGPEVMMIPTNQCHQQNPDHLAS